MAVQVSEKKTSKFIDNWAHIPWIVAFGLLVAIPISSFFPVFKSPGAVKVTKDRPVKVTTLELDPKQLGALRIDVTPSFPSNHWLIYELRLVDQQGQIITSAIDEAWRESGTWREGGESGYWSKEDLLGGLDIKSPKAEKVDLVIAVLESGTTSGKPADLEVIFQVYTVNGVIQTRHLFWGAVFSVILGILARIATKSSGQTVINCEVDDSDPKARAVLGGKNRLIQVKIQTKLDENVLDWTRANLRINNGLGETVYEDTAITKSKIKKVRSQGDIEKCGTASFELFFVLQERDSYSFQVQVKPDNPVDWTSLIVREGAKTAKKVDVIEIKTISTS